MVVEVRVLILEAAYSSLSIKACRQDIHRITATQATEHEVIFYSDSSYRTLLISNSTFNLPVCEYYTDLKGAKTKYV